MSAFVVGFISVFAFIAVIIAIPFIWIALTKRSASPAPASAGAGTGVAFAKKATFWLIGVAVVIVAVAYFVSNDAAKAITDAVAKAPVLVATVILIVLAILGFLGKGGEWGKRLAGLFVIFLIGYVVFHFVFDEKSDVVAKKLRDDAVKIMTEDTPPQAKQKVVVASSEMVGIPVPLKFKEMSRVIKLYPDQCYQWWGKRGPDDRSFDAWVRGANHSTWVRWSEFHQLKCAKRLPYEKPAWLAFEGLERGAVAYYNHYPKDSVECEEDPPCE